MIELTETEKAYLAGIFDGEGSIGLYNTHGRAFQLVLSVSNKNKTLLEWIVSKVQCGNIRHNQRKLSAYTYWEWFIRDRTPIKTILEQIKPFLIVKADQVALVLDFLDSPAGQTYKKGGNLTDGLVLERKAAANKLSLLKDRRHYKNVA